MSEDQEFKYRIRERGGNSNLMAWKIEVHKTGVFPPIVIVRYQGRDYYLKHHKAMNLDNLEIECLTEEAERELAQVKQEYEQIKKRGIG